VLAASAKAKISLSALARAGLEVESGLVLQLHELGRTGVAGAENGCCKGSSGKGQEKKRREEEGGEERASIAQAAQ